MHHPAIADSGVLEFWGSRQSTRPPESIQLDWTADSVLSNQSVAGTSRSGFWSTFMSTVTDLSLAPVTVNAVRRGAPDSDEHVVGDVASLRIDSDAGGVIRRDSDEVTGVTGSVL